MTKTTEALINRLVWSLFITADELRRYPLKDLEARDAGRLNKLPDLDQPTMQQEVPVPRKKSHRR